MLKFANRRVITLNLLFNIGENGFSWIPWPRNENQKVADVADTPAESEINTQHHELADLLARVTQGDERALAEFYDLTSSRVYSMALYILKDPGMAEEVTLDVFLQIWQRASQFDPTRGKPITWVTVLARSRSIDRLRACQKEKGKYQFLDTVNIQQTAQPTIETIGMSCDQSRTVQNALMALSPEQRQVIVMAYFSGLSQREIAEKIDKPLGTVKTRIRLGMINLRKTLNSSDEGCVLW